MAQVKQIPVYKLYGEQEPWPTPDMVHCESIAARSQLHNWQIKPHQHNGLFQILFLQQGAAKIQIDDAQYDMAAGQILMVPQMCIHGFRFERNAVGHVVTLAYELINLLMRLTRQAGDGLVALSDPSIHALGDDAESGYIRMAFSALDAEYRGNAPYRKLQIEALLGAILIWLARSAPHHALAHAQESGKSAEHFANFRALIEQHFAEQKPLAWYARQLGITAAHLNALCRRTVGRSALALLHERMLLEAKRNLVYTSMTISVVGYAIGFSDPAYFTRFFKRQAGVSPKEFRKRAGT
jgi:AraC family transcriptional regulator, transcriptional activator of pobA